MKKIMFNDRFGLTQAVIDGRKTITRRIAYTKDVRFLNLGWDVNTHQRVICDGEFVVARSQYKIDEVVAIAQSYKDINELGIVQSKPTQGDEYIWFGNGGGTEHVWAENHAGWTNKMFVKADLMPHHIKITNIRVEHLQDISDDDCMKEGIYKHDPVHIVGYNHNFIAYSYDATEDPHLKKWWFRTPREAFQKLIDKVSGKGTWDSNPLVFVYEFELVD